MKPEDYTHRIGRTGRAGRSGLAITFAEWRDQRRMHAIEQHTRQPLQAETVAGLEPRARPKAPVRPRKQTPASRPAGRLDGRFHTRADSRTGSETGHFRPETNTGDHPSPRNMPRQKQANHRAPQRTGRDTQHAGAPRRGR